MVAGISLRASVFPHSTGDTVNPIPTAASPGSASYQISQPGSKRAETASSLGVLARNEVNITS